MPVPEVTLTGSALTGVAPHLMALPVAQMPAKVKLGRNRPKVRPPVLKLKSYLTTFGATPPPPSVDYYTKAAAATSHMYLNDQYGCCVVSEKAHKLGIWSANDTDSGGTVIATDNEIYQQYQEWCGPGDNGCVITQVLDIIKARGMKAGGKTYKIDGYVEADWTNKLEVQVALYLFGGLTIGVNLPQAWTQNAVWDVTNTQIVGGHDVGPCGYNAQGVQVTSWGRIYTITWQAFLQNRWVEEMYVPLGPLWYNSDKLAPNGLDVAALLADLDKLGGGVIPDVGPPSPPVPPTPVPPTPVPPFPPGPTPIKFRFDGTFTGTVTPID